MMWLSARRKDAKREVRWMMLILSLLALGAWLGSDVGLASSPLVGDKPDLDFVPGQVLVGYASPPGFHHRSEKTTTTLGDVQLRVVVTPPGRELEIAERLADLPDVLWAEPNYVLQAQGAPNDPLWPEQWGPQQVGLTAARGITFGDPHTIVAIADTGVDLDHPDLPPLWEHPGELPGNDVDDDGNGLVDDVHGWHWYTDFSGQVQGDSDIQMPGEGDPGVNTIAFHGMHVAGISSAMTDNITGVAGMTQGPRVMVLRILDRDGFGSILAATNAIEYAVANHANVINLSLGSRNPSETLNQAIRDAIAAGVVVVAAAGNGSGALLYPAALPEVIAVGGNTRDDTHYARSNRGPQLDLTAPAVDILSTWASTVHDGYFTSTGTSMATAHVTGVAALLFSLHPEASPAQISDWLTAAALDLGAPGRDDTFGWGRLQAEAALVSAASTLTLTAVASPPVVAPGGSAYIQAVIRDAQGALVGSGLPISMTSPIGQLAPASVLTQDGVAVSMLTAAADLHPGDHTPVAVRWLDQEVTLALPVSDGVPVTGTLHLTPTTVAAGETITVTGAFTDALGAWARPGTTITLTTNSGVVTPAEAQLDTAGRFLALWRTGVDGGSHVITATTGSLSVAAAAWQPHRRRRVTTCPWSFALLGISVYGAGGVTGGQMRPRP